ncbi:hypothetical protein [Streptomyces zaehneri]|uniref:hypothetical protein n=1 Tax=Streptomyces zaehneri TaxID=3051180 RepID=UPI0028D06F48|nr:hypothetical protein [Streptomyces sp. DSM 40713]
MPLQKLRPYREAAAGFGIGVVAAIRGVAGGRLLIPTIRLLFGKGKNRWCLTLLVSG